MSLRLAAEHDLRGGAKDRFDRLREHFGDLKCQRQARVVATGLDRVHLARAANSLASVTNVAPVICHGDLHPFNLLVDHDRWTLIDWSTAVVTDRHYDLAFTTMMLANPPLGGPTPVRTLARAIGRQLANRFLRTYEQRTGQPLDRERLDWGRRAHALRVIVEVATWEANDEIAAHHGHPWLAMRRQLEAALAKRGDWVAAASHVAVA